jgi:very-short-patch-repair endonuclease
MALHIRINNIPAPEREYRFHPKRKWRFDFAWPAEKLAMEVEGGVWGNGRHTTGVGFTGDCVKLNEAVCAGWRVLRVTADQIDNGAAIDWLRRSMTAQGAEAAPF